MRLLSVKMGAERQLYAGGGEGKQPASTSQTARSVAGNETSFQAVPSSRLVPRPSHQRRSESS